MGDVLNRRQAGIARELVEHLPAASPRTLSKTSERMLAAADAAVNYEAARVAGHEVLRGIVDYQFVRVTDEEMDRLVLGVVLAALGRGDG